MREQIAAHVLEHQLADARDLHGTVAQAELVNHDQHGQKARQFAEQCEVLRRNRAVDHNLHQIRLDHLDATHRHDDGEDAQHLRHIRFQVDADTENIV